MEYPDPDFDPPYRVLVLVASTDGWYAARRRTERDARPTSSGASCARPKTPGARLIGSFDDDLFLTGQPAPLPYTIFVLYDVDDLARHRTARPPAAHLDSSRRFLRLEARVGRPLFVLDN